MADQSTVSPTISNKSRISVGIGSWTDAEYTGLLFPKGVRSDERLKVYATRFDHVEVNSGYHAMPRRAWVESWVKQTPPGFLFDFKLHKSVSEDPEKTAREGTHLSYLLDTTKPLIDAGKLGVFFMTLPPSFGPERRRLEELDGLVDKLRPHPLAVELRHNGWIDGEQRDRTLAYFRARQMVWIAVDMPRLEKSKLMPPVDEVTNPHIAYLRLHGRNKDWLKLKSAEERHTHRYTAEELGEVAVRVRGLAERAGAVRVVANNHAQDFAPQAALALQQLLGIARPRAASPEDELLPGF